jgi:AmmeMemoRadiSam system protein A
MLSQKEKKILINIVEETIKAKIDGEAIPDFYYGQQALNVRTGAFVTLKIDNELRGCIGMISSNKPLYQTISEMALQAAFCDPRFEPLTLEELNKLGIEVSILSPLKKVGSIDEIEVGRDGLLIKKNLSSGLLLPQVAVEYCWDKYSFLEQVCLKAGLNADAWKEDDADIYKFTAEVFSSDEDF